MIRLLGEADAAPLRALRLRALREEPDSFLSSHDVEAAEPEEATRQRLRDVAGSTIAGVLGAFDGSALVGMLVLVAERHRKASHRASLAGFYVAPEGRGRGVGWALIEAAVERSRAAGIEQVHLTVSTTAQQARRLYARAGFVRVATLEDAMKDGARYLDEDLMILRL
jgi:ribosomal protein S18 acetylase RimI-like enzyme